MAHQTEIATLGPVWCKGSARFEDGWIVLSDPVSYDLGNRPTMPFELAAVENPRDAVRFANQHGLLWHGADTDPSERRELFLDWQSAILELRVMFNLAVALDEVKRGRKHDIDWLQHVHETRFEAKAHADALRDDGQLIYDMTRVLAAALSGKIATSQFGVYPRPDSDGKYLDLFFGITPANLIAQAYYEISRLVVNRREVRNCIECGRPFPVRDKRMQYCTSTCSERARNRRRAEKQRAAKV